MKRFPYPAILLAALLLAGVFLVLERVPPPPPPAADVGERAVQEGRPAAVPPPGREGTGGRIAILIDDVGYDRRILRELEALPLPLAFAILPFTPHAAEADRDLHAAGREILLHLPLEPRTYPTDDPGKGALFTGMDAGTLRSRLQAALAEVPHALGVNNHMGSRFTEDEGAMAVLMAELARRRLFFIDSLTTAHSCARVTAAAAGVPFAVRSAFIDHLPDDRTALDRLVQHPRREAARGPLLLIGHPRPETLRALQAALPVWRQQGTEVIPLAALLEAGNTGSSSQGRKR